MLCETELGPFGQPDSCQSCGRPTDQLVTTGCVHEHLITQPTCLACIDRIELPGRMQLRCNECEDSASPHHCTIRLIARETITE